ncbi:MAG: MBL fold metallo-hydrolase [marine benthic group bacterium]|nr:MBL fold metallo-hydrolase [Candidatus Benthicola marisminoris]
MPEAPVLEGQRARVRAVDAGSLWLDGGAMFGVVPKPLWSRRAAPDERNRIPLAMRCLLVQTDESTVLIDTGLGDKEGEKFRGIYRVSNDGDPARLQSSLADLDVAPEDVDVVVATHLHFDHAGGGTVRRADGSLGPAFPSARYVVNRAEYEFARRDNERIRASYMADNFEPLASAGVLDLVDDGAEIVPGIRYVPTPGHTPGHQSVRIDLGDEVLLFLADLVPTVAHLPLPWIMGYDVEPLVTLESKRETLTRAADRGWWLAFEHDPVVAWGRAVKPASGAEGCELEAVLEHPLVAGADRAGRGEN